MNEGSDQGFRNVDENDGLITFPFVPKNVLGNLSVSTHRVTNKHTERERERKNIYLNIRIYVNSTKK